MARSSRVIIVIMMLALVTMACNLSGDTTSEQAEAQPTPNVPVVDIRVPDNGTSFAEGITVIIQVVGTDSGPGVSRIDLMIDDLSAGSQNAPNPAGQSAFIANFEWQAAGQGLHSISAQAFRQDGTASSPVAISVNVIQAPPTEPVQDTPVPTEAPAEVPEEQPVEEEPTEEPPPTEPEPTATPTGPRGEITAGVNVRRGPSTQYEAIGSLLAGTEVELRGRNADNTWFLIPYALSQGWVFGQFINTSGDINSLPVVEAPPLPPTATPVPVVPTAIPATAAPAGPIIEFRHTVDESKTYPAGTCFRFWWNAQNIAGVYFQDQGVSGDNNADGREVCINSTTTFTLRVIKTDGTEDVRSVTAKIG